MPVPALDLTEDDAALYQWLEHGVDPSGVPERLIAADVARSTRLDDL